MDRWNNADTTLLCAALCFLAAVGVKILSPESLFAEGFLFVSEAAMVGGIADWFAVTALFKKPLGFPFHTAILPNRREDFVNASVKMVQKEFFSRRTILKKMGDFHLLPLLIQYLEKNETKKFLLEEILTATKNYLSKFDKSTLAKKIAGKLRREIYSVPAKNLIDECGDRLKRNNNDQEFFISIVKKVRATAEKSETRDKIQKVLEKYAEERTQSAGAFSILMAGLAQMLNLVNFEEAAEIMQTQLLKLLDELSADTPMQRRVLNECRLKISELAETSDFRDLVEHLQVDTASALPLENAVERALKNLESQIISVDLDYKGRENLGSLLLKVLDEEYTKFVEVLKSDGEGKQAVEKLIYDLIARTVLYAQPLVGTVARSALEKMTVEKLNSLVYDKAEPDFVWIRMNGSLVGSLIGLVIFGVIKFLGV